MTTLISPSSGRQDKGSKVTCWRGGGDWRPSPWGCCWRPCTGRRRSSCRSSPCGRASTPRWASPAWRPSAWACRPASGRTSPCCFPHCAQVGSAVSGAAPEGFQYTPLNPSWKGRITERKTGFIPLAFKSPVALFEMEAGLESHQSIENNNKNNPSYCCDPSSDVGTSEAAEGPDACLSLLSLICDLGFFKIK